METREQKNHAFVNKQYYTDLEEKVMLYEEEIKKLKTDLKYYKEKGYFYEPTKDSEPTEESHKGEDKFFAEIREYAVKNPTEIKKITEKCIDYFNIFGPYGTQRTEVLNSCFDSIIDNILPGTFKLAMGSILEDIPSDLSKLEKYIKLSKFEKFEKYPKDETRQFVNQMGVVKIDNAEWENFNVNLKPIYLEIKQKLKDSVRSLLKTRTQLFETLMQLDAYTKFFGSRKSKGANLTDYLKAYQGDTTKVLNESLWNIKSEAAKYQYNIPIADEEVERKAIEECEILLPTTRDFEYEYTKLYVE